VGVQLGLFAKPLGMNEGSNVACEKKEDRSLFALFLCVSSAFWTEFSTASLGDKSDALSRTGKVMSALAFSSLKLANTCVSTICNHVF